MAASASRAVQLHSFRRLAPLAAGFTAGDQAIHDAIQGGRREFAAAEFRRGVLEFKMGARPPYPFVRPGRDEYFRRRIIPLPPKRADVNPTPSTFDRAVAGLKMLFVKEDHWDSSAALVGHYLAYPAFLHELLGLGVLVWENDVRLKMVPTVLRDASEWDAQMRARVAFFEAPEVISHHLIVSTNRKLLKLEFGANTRRKEQIKGWVFGRGRGEEWGLRIANEILKKQGVMAFQLIPRDESRQTANGAYVDSSSGHDVRVAYKTKTFELPEGFNPYDPEDIYPGKLNAALSLAGAQLASSLEVVEGDRAEIYLGIRTDKELDKEQMSKVFDEVVRRHCARLSSTPVHVLARFLDSKYKYRDFQMQVEI